MVQLNKKSSSEQEAEKLSELKKRLKKENRRERGKSFPFWFRLELRRLFLKLLSKLRISRNILGRGIYYIGSSEALPPPLTAAEEKSLIDQLNYSAKGQDNELNKGIKETLIERNLRLVVYIARKFENTGVGVEDLISIGTIGLIKAVNTFDPEKKIKLATYASRCIENEILMCLRRNNRIRSEVSFDEPLNIDWDGNELLLSDVLGTENDIVCKSLEEDVEKKLLFMAIARLSPREKTIMDLRFGLGGREEKTQKDVAEILGISQSYISRLEKRIIRKLKKEICRME